MAHVHWPSLYAKKSADQRCDITFLTCLSQVTEIEMILLMQRYQVWPSQYKCVCCMSLLLTFSPANFAKVH